MPYRFVTLMNPAPKRKTMKARRRRSIRSVRPVIARRPARRRRSSAPKATRSRHHSPAMRAKISRAVKAAMRRRKSGAVSSTRRRSLSYRRPARRPARRHSGFAVARRSNRIVMGRLLNPSGRRRIRRRNPGGVAGGALSSIKGMLGKDTLVMAAGAVAASVGTGFVLNRFGSKLPLANTKYGGLFYQIGIPLAAAYVLRKKNRSFAQGLVLGGVIMGITSIMKSGMLGAQVAALQPTGSYAYDGVTGMGLAGELGRGGVRAMKAYVGASGGPSIGNAVNTPVFAPSAWS